MIPKIKEIQDYLQGNSRRKFQVLDHSSNVALTEKMNLDDVIGQGSDNMETFFQKLNIAHPTVAEMRVDLLKPIGNNRNTKKDDFIITWQPKTFLGEGSSVQDAGGNAPASTEQFFNQNSNTMSNTVPNSPQQLGNFGLGAAFEQHVDLRLKAKGYDELKEKISDYKKKVKKLEEKNEVLHTELREAKVDLKTAETFKNLELLKKDLEKKPLVDPETAKLALSQLAPIVSAFAARGQQQPAGALAGAENLSPSKKSLVDEINKPEFTDEMAGNLINLYMVMLENNSTYNSQLASIINQYNTQ